MMNGDIVKGPECQQLIEAWPSRTTRRFIASQDWTRIDISNELGVKLYARSAGTNAPIVEIGNPQLKEKLLDLAQHGVGHVGAEHDGAEFKFENMLDAERNQNNR